MKSFLKWESLKGILWVSIDQYTTILDYHFQKKRPTSIIPKSNTTNEKSIIQLRGYFLQTNAYLNARIIFTDVGAICVRIPRLASRVYGVDVHVIKSG